MTFPSSSIKSEGHHNAAWNKLPTSHNISERAYLALTIDNWNSYYFENRLGYTIKKEKSDITCIEPVFSLDKHITNPIFEEITEKEFNEVLEKYNEFNTRFNP